jgi:hypothetical protein
MFSFSKISDILSKIFDYFGFKKNISKKYESPAITSKNLINGNISYMINDPYYPDLILQIKESIQIHRI